MNRQGERALPGTRNRPREEDASDAPSNPSTELTRHAIQQNPDPLTDRPRPHKLRGRARRLRQLGLKAECVHRSLRAGELPGRAIAVHARQRRVRVPRSDRWARGAVGLPLFENPDGSLTAEGQTFAGPALRSAERACKAYLPPAGGPPAKVRAQQLRQELAFARCMRAHGVPNFPDPSSSWRPAGPPAGLDPQSPAFGPLHACAAPAAPATSRSGAEHARPRPDEPPRKASVLAEDPNREASRFRSTRH